MWTWVVRCAGRLWQRCKFMGWWGVVLPSLSAQVQTDPGECSAMHKRTILLGLVAVFKYIKGPHLNRL